MIVEIGEILEILRDRISDFEKDETVSLLDGQSTPIKFPRTERLETRRFISLVNSSLPALSHLARNLTAESIVRQVERTDTVIGSVDYRATMMLYQREPTATGHAVCNVIDRDFNTPENQ